MQPHEDQNRIESTSVAPAQDDEQAGEEPMLYCPVCNHRLVSRRCKLLCEECGYFMSCADYY